MTRCPLCAGTGELCNDANEATVNELRDVHDPARPTDLPWQADLRRLLKVLHRACVDDDIERAAERRKKKAASTA